MFLTANSTDSRLSEKLRSVVDWNKDLPEYVFLSRAYNFFFFERPIVYSGALLENLFAFNAQCYSADSFVSFGIPESAGYAQFFFDEVKPELRVSILQQGFRDFFGGAVDYPVLLTNKNIDWIAFESAYEELGVLAVRSDSDHADKFINLFEAEAFISCEQMKVDTPGFLHLFKIYGDLIHILRRNYCSVL